MNLFRRADLGAALLVVFTAACTSHADSGSHGGYLPPGSEAVPRITSTPDADGGVTEDESFVLQLSADDSTSMASALIAKRPGFLPTGELHRHEFTNYFDPPRALADAEPWALTAEVSPGVTLAGELLDRAPVGENPGELTALLSLQAAPVVTETRRPWHLVYCIDVSGSMQGVKMEFVRDALVASLDRLRSGDTVTLVTFTDDAALVFDSARYPEDAAVIAQGFRGLAATGGTNMIAGLRLAYERAQASRSAGTLSRVLVFGDGHANIGPTDLESFRQATRVGQEEGVYLTSVGVGEGFDWARMDELADAGKGASVYVPDAIEATRLFGTEQFTKLVEISVDEVRVELELPKGLTLVDFSGEEVSFDPDTRLPSVVLAAGDDLTMLARFRYADPALLDRPFTIRLTMRPLGTGEPISFERTVESLRSFVRGGGGFATRARIVDDYGRWATALADAPTSEAIVTAIDGFAPDDPGLAEIRRRLTP